MGSWVLHKERVWSRDASDSLTSVAVWVGFRCFIRVSYQPDNRNKVFRRLLSLQQGRLQQVIHRAHKPQLSLGRRF